MWLSKQVIRLRKILRGVRHPICWQPLSKGVGASVEHDHALKGLQIDGVIDVGANVGQFALECRVMLPSIPIVSFEPFPASASTFRKVHRACRDVRLVEVALGECRGTATLHLSKSNDSSSLLPIGELQSRLFRNTEEVGTIEVPVATLDDFCAEWPARSRQLLKLDVQGFELAVLRGGQHTLKSCEYVYVECSEVELYKGQSLRSEVEVFLESHGFMSHIRFNPQFSGTTLVQADYMFSRKLSSDSNSTP